MSDFVIGSWVRREKNLSWLNPRLWHLVDSDIADSAITHCGRRMQATTKTGGALIRFSLPDRPAWIDSCLRCWIE